MKIARHTVSRDQDACLLTLLPCPVMHGDIVLLYSWGTCMEQRSRSSRSDCDRFMADGKTITTSATLIGHAKWVLGRTCGTQGSEQAKQISSTLAVNIRFQFSSQRQGCSHWSMSSGQFLSFFRSFFFFLFAVRLTPPPSSSSDIKPLYFVLLIQAELVKCKSSQISVSLLILSWTYRCRLSNTTIWACNVLYRATNLLSCKRA